MKKYKITNRIEDKVILDTDNYIEFKNKVLQIFNENEETTMQPPKSILGCKRYIDEYCDNLILEMDTNLRQTIYYKGIDNVEWEMNIFKNNTISIKCNKLYQIYRIPENIEKIEQKDEYVFLYLTNGNYYQFKFSEDYNLFGDVFDSDDEWIDTFANENFVEEM